MALLLHALGGVGASLDKILQAARRLPPFPRAALQALELLENPDVSAAKLSSVIELDMSLTSAVLRTANSAYYGFPGRVDNLKQALAFLGNRVFRELVITAAAGSLLGGSQSGYRLAPGDLWHHSLATSLMTQVLCERMKRKPGAALFTAALLHDIGKLVLSTFVQDKAQLILAEVAQGLPFLEAERKVLEFDHAELGARIVESWRFSPELVDLIRFHHDPGQHPQSADLATLCVANVACNLYGLGGGLDALALRSHGALVEQLGLTDLDLEACLAEMHMRLQKATEGLRSTPAPVAHPA